MTFEEWWESDISTDSVCKSRYDKAEAAWEAGVQEGIDRTKELIEALEEAVYLLNPTDEDMQKKAGVYRVVTALEKLKEKNK